jgi:hypothetical protein
VTLSEATASATRLAMVGLAKNTGKTVALTALLRELEAAGRRVGVTSVGRDGEEHDVIDARIDKPRVLLPSGSLVATTDSLLSASGLPHELLERTDMRTPLGRVLIARLHGPGPIEVAGPSAAAEVRAVSDAMLGHGAEQVLIDGAMDRRAAASPAVADGLVLSTGAVLSSDIAEVVLRTKDAVDLTRLPPIDDRSPAGGDALAPSATDPGRRDLDSAAHDPLRLSSAFVLTADSAQIAQLLDANPGVTRLLVPGALPEAFARDLVHAAHRRHRDLTVVVADSTKVFSRRGVSWYRRQGIDIRVRSPTTLSALTVNPVAPRSHSFESTQLQALIERATSDVPIFDVMRATLRAP